MGSLGLLVILAAFAGAVLLGYQLEWNHAHFGVVVLCLMIGQIMHRAGKSSEVFRSRGLGLPFEILGLVVLNAVVAAIGYGIGYAIIELLAFRPEGGL
jgi:hypothetical protein